VPDLLCLIMRSKFKILFASGLCLIAASSVLAMETDQYNLPTAPLADIGEEVTQHVELALIESVEKINREIASQESCLAAAKPVRKCGSKRKIEKRLAYLRSEDAIAKAIYKRLGDGMIPFTKISLWLDWHKFDARPARYRTSYADSVHLTAPMNYVTISPTIRMYGEEFGTDKIAHMFQQGFDYYAKYRGALAKGANEEAAIKKAIKWGRMTEKTYFGIWVSAIYSNADLAANYAGLKFYIGLTNEIMIEGYVRPPLLTLENGSWQFRGASRTRLLKPFISRHFNEAYNPSKIFNIAGYRSVIRKIVRKRVCSQWFKRDPGLSRSELEMTAKSLETWNGEDYGFSRSKNFVTIANTCFEANG